MYCFPNPLVGMNHADFLPFCPGADAQKLTYSQSSGWIFWSFKIEQGPNQREWWKLTSSTWTFELTLAQGLLHRTCTRSFHPRPCRTPWPPRLWSIPAVDLSIFPPLAYQPSYTCFLHQNRPLILNRTVLTLTLYIVLMNLPLFHSWSFASWSSSLISNSR